MYSIVEFTTPAHVPDERLIFGQAATPVGPATLVWGETGVRELSFQPTVAGDIDHLLAPPIAPISTSATSALSVRDDAQAAALMSAIFEQGQLSLPLVLCGTAFQREVWRTLMTFRLGQTVSYGELAKRLGKPAAARAVGSAVGANRLGFLVPCHRVVRQDGVIGQFRWGTDIKAKLLAWETQQTNE